MMSPAFPKHSPPEKTAEKFKKIEDSIVMASARGP